MQRISIWNTNIWHLNHLRADFGAAALEPGGVVVVLGRRRFSLSQLVGFFSGFGKVPSGGGRQLLLAALAASGCAVRIAAMPLLMLAVVEAPRIAEGRARVDGRVAGEGVPRP